MVLTGARVVDEEGARAVLAVGVGCTARSRKGGCSVVREVPTSVVQVGSGWLEARNENAQAVFLGAAPAALDQLRRRIAHGPTAPRCNSFTDENTRSSIAAIDPSL